MPSPRTEASELAVAFGILSLDPSDAIPFEEVGPKFDNTLSAKKYISFLGEFKSRTKLHSRMYKVGARLRSSVPQFSDVETLRWAGPDRQASTMTASSDLLVANTPVSVKAISNVVANPSPHNLIHNLPSGQVFSRNERNWYLEKAPREFQDLYAFVKGSSPSLYRLPQQVNAFEETATSDDRNTVQKVIGAYDPDRRTRFRRYYLQMCHKVAQESADEFNDRVTRTMNGRARAAVFETMMRWFFRLDSVSYVLCGIDARRMFGLLIPSLTEFKSSWNLDQIEALPNLDRRQSVVDFALHFSHRNEALGHTANFHTELRWSHGRFCGAPEAKLYKDFHYSDLPFLIDLL